MAAYEVLELKDLVAVGRQLNGVVHVDCPAERRAFRVRVGVDLGHKALRLVRAEACWGDSLVERALTEADDADRRGVERFVEALGAGPFAVQAPRCTGCSALGEALTEAGGAQLCDACLGEPIEEVEDHEPYCPCEPCTRERARFKAVCDRHHVAAMRADGRRRLGWVGLPEDVSDGASDDEEG
jgi:hypothetical protein